MYLLQRKLIALVPPYGMRRARIRPKRTFRRQTGPTGRDWLDARVRWICAWFLLDVRVRPGVWRGERDLPTVSQGTLPRSPDQERPQLYRWGRVARIALVSHLKNRTQFSYQLR